MNKINYEKPTLDIKLIQLELNFITSGSDFTPDDTGGNAGDIESGDNFGDSGDFQW